LAHKNTGHASSVDTQSTNRQIAFPNRYLGLQPSSTVPFHRDHFRQVVNKLRLPDSTAWLLQSDSSSFQSYNLNGSRIGLTLRRVSRGILAADFALSMSYCTETGEINALLMGTSLEQAEYIRETLSDLKEYAIHPALLPTILYSCTRSLLGELIHQEQEKMFQFEAMAGRTDVHIIIGGRIMKPEKVGHRDILKSARSILQLVMAWEYLSKSLLLEIDVLNRFVDSLAAATNDNRIKVCSEIIIERLRFVSLKGNEVLFVAQKVKDRVQMQLEAFSNVLALQNNETSLNIAASTRTDSAAMTSIALLTMAFLPSTFLAVSTLSFATF
jgi:hypothetical protein